MIGTTINGEEFDSSFKRGKPATFAPNQVPLLREKKQRRCVPSNV